MCLEKSSQGGSAVGGMSEDAVYYMWQTAKGSRVVEGGNVLRLESRHSVDNSLISMKPPRHSVDNALIPTKPPRGLTDAIPVGRT